MKRKMTALLPCFSGRGVHAGDAPEDHRRAARAPRPQIQFQAQKMVLSAVSPARSLRRSNLLMVVAAPKCCLGARGERP